MASEDDLIDHLMGFGLTKKEAHCYFHLLKYGPKTPSPLAKSLRTYRVDVHRTLNSLIDKGMVNTSLASPTLYTAVDLDIALDAALKKRESELREMEASKQALRELSKQQQLRPVEDVATFKIIKNMKELTGVSLSVVPSIREEHVFVFPARAMSIGALGGITEALTTLAARGVRVRGIVDMPCADPSCAGIELVQELLDGGADVRYLDQYHGAYFSVSDRKLCASVINVNVQRASLSAPITVLWADDRIYAESLVSTFELLWEQAVPAAQRIRQLRAESPRTLGD